MRLFTNGCSFTYGAEIINNELGILYENVGKHDEFADKFRSENNWSFFLNQKLNSTLLTNYSTGGGSNKRIFRTTIDFFIDLMSKKECVNDYVAVIQWTEINRYEVYDNIIEDFAFLSIRDPWGKPEHIDYIRDRYSVLSQELMKLDEQNSLEDFKSCMLALSGFFEKHKIKYLFCNMNPKSLRSLPSYFLESYNWLGKDIEQSSITKILVEEGNNTQKYFYPYKHPSVEGHKIIAEKLYNRLQELYTL